MEQPLIVFDHVNGRVLVATADERQTNPEVADALRFDPDVVVSASDGRPPT